MQACPAKLLPSLHWTLYIASPPTSSKGKAGGNESGLLYLHVSAVLVNIVRIVQPISHYTAPSETLEGNIRYINICNWQSHGRFRGSLHPK